MEDSFIHFVTKDILKRLKGNLDNSAVIFPNQKPEQYFLKELKSEGYKGKPPQIFSIEKFIDSHSGTDSENSIDLLIILFKLYLEHYPEAEFDSYYSWGSMMLSDFDEIDRYMADPVSLFKNLSAVKDLEKYFLQEQTLPFEMLPELSPEDEQYLTKRFLENWEVYEKLYFEFKKELSAQNKAYTGMNFRKLAETLQNGAFGLAFNKYIFIGFNAISKSEEIIIQKLIDLDKALIYWDADNYFIDNDREGSGYFIRRSLQNLHGYNEQVFGNQLLTGSKDIHIIGAPLRVGQSKALAIELKKLFSINKPGNACIVLADENMLSPVLYAIPGEAEPVNLSSGYPLKFSSLYSLFQCLTNLINNYREESHSFYYKDVLAVLSHPLIRNQDEDEMKRLSDKIQNDQLIFISQDEIWGENLEEETGSDILKLYFKEVLNLESLHQYFYDVYLNAGKKSEQSENEPFALIFDEMFSLLKYHGQIVKLKMYLRIFKEKVNKASSNGKDQNTDNLQIMGMLETRTLDFETVFMLPVNEGIIPENKRNRSYIPYDIRRNFSLPMQDEQENIYAYNFYRLLQRAKNIYLVYDSETSDGGDEESRYIRQIEYYLPSANPNIKIQRRYYGLPLGKNPSKEITIRKEKLFNDVLMARNESGLSPSLFSSYFICSLQFYFKNVLKIPEKESIVEELEAKHFGTLFHDLMDRIYDGLKGKLIDKDVINKRRRGLTIALDKVLTHQYGKQKESVVLKNNILIETVKILADKALDADMNYAPFKLIDTEVLASWQMPYFEDGFETIHLKGIIDRIDEKDGVTRIVDYKTGSVKTYHFNYTEPEEILYKDNKEAFQTLFYGMLYLKKNPDARLKPTILPLREVIKGYVDVNARDGLFGSNESVVFENKLKSIIHTILDPDLSIGQTEDLNICKMCSYKNICMR